jgi:hypothetical protein
VEKFYKHRVAAPDVSAARSVCASAISGNSGVGEKPLSVVRYDRVTTANVADTASLVVNTIMLSNVADMTGVLSSAAKDGYRVTPGLVACLSPYTREHIRRFGHMFLIWTTCPTPLSRSHFHSSRHCDHFLHVSSTYPCLANRSCSLARYPGA